jgi:16S rRNA (cytosine1407-C5)-methyltransferase
VSDQLLLVEELLRAQGFIFEPDPFYSFARRLLYAPLPLGLSIASFFGYIYIQDRSSMLPPLALSPKKGDCVLDLCASPGGKSGMLSLMCGAEGFTLANEPSPKRLVVLRSNMQNQNLLACITASCPGENFPLPRPFEQAKRGVIKDRLPNYDEVEAASRKTLWDAILLDPPCSGWGTAEKNPRVLDLWQGDKIKALTTLQKKLLGRAARLLKPGGRLVYSTCTSNNAENEEQIHYACEELGLEFLPLPFFPQAFALDAAQLPQYTGVWRVRANAGAKNAGGAGDGSDLGGQGFFVALLRKPASGTCLDESGDRVQRPHTGVWPKKARPAEDLPYKRAGKGRRGPGKVGEADFFVTRMTRSALAGPYLDPDLLPEGGVVALNSRLYFIPGRAMPYLGMLADGMVKGRGFLLGRLGGGGDLHTNPWLRALMPDCPSLAASAIPTLDLDESGPIVDLLAGRNLDVETKAKEIGLYFRGLPLCRLAVKGHRAMLPPPWRQGS